MVGGCRVAVAVVCALGLALPGSAAAEQVSSGEWAERTAAAAADPADSLARERLLAVEAVDGFPVEAAAALEDARGGELERRLQTLAEAAQRLDEVAAGERAEPGRARADADRISSELRAPAERGGEEAAPADGRGDGGLAAWTWILLAALAAALAAVVAVRIARGREATASLSRAAPVRSGEDDLAARAEEAEAAGRYALALRLRLALAVDGLVRAGAISSRPSLTAREVAAAIADPRAVELVGTFEEVTYGGREATRGDAGRARELWPELLEQAGRR